jgi:HEAT repeat protein
MRTIPFLFLLSLAAGAQDAQIDWVGDWEQAFGRARQGKKPVMVCINSKDGESASEEAAKKIYRDPEFVALSRRFVMIIVSTIGHQESGLCPRFGRITCEQHVSCWKALSSGHGDHFVIPGSNGEMISPQHAWFHPNGQILSRREYQSPKSALIKRMKQILDDVASGADPGEPPVTEDKDAPLNEKDLAELERVKKSDKEARRAALGNVLATGKISARVAVVDLLLATKRKDLRADIVRALGKANAIEAREAIDSCLKDRDAFVRSCAAVALETLAQPQSVEALIKRAKSERDTFARKNVYHALGACGGGAAHKNAAKRLLKGMTSDKQNVIRRHAALALRRYEGEGAKLVVKPLEQTALKTKDREVRGAIVYTLAYIGNPRTTLPVFEQILEKQRDPIGTAYMKSAIRVLKGEEGEFGRSAWWLFREHRDDPARK